MSLGLHLSARRVARVQPALAQPYRLWKSGEAISNAATSDPAPVARKPGEPESPPLVSFTIISRVSEESVPWKSRSEIIRHAVQQLVENLERAQEEKREREIFRRHGARLNRQAAALIKEQAR